MGTVTSHCSVCVAPGCSDGTTIGSLGETVQPAGACSDAETFVAGPPASLRTTPVTVMTSPARAGLPASLDRWSRLMRAGTAGSPEVWAFQTGEGTIATGTPPRTV